MGKFCNTHLVDLKSTIDKKGLGSLCTNDKELLAIKMQRWLEGRVRRRSDFDPLGVAHMEINAKAQEMFGQGEHSKKCPLCQADHFLKGSAGMTWLDNATDAVLLFAKQNHLI